MKIHFQLLFEMRTARFSNNISLNVEIPSLNQLLRFRQHFNIL